MRTAEVLVAGGGPAGASLAFALARAGVDVHVLDRAHFPRAKPCAEFLSPQASRLLSDMGALDRVEESGAAALAGVHVRAPNGAMIKGDFVSSHGFRGYRDRGLSVRREVLDTILLDCARAAGARVSEGVRVTDVTRDAGRAIGVTALCDQTTRQLQARIIVGADGLRSVVARRLGLSHTQWWPRRLALVSHYANVLDIGEYGEMHVERDGYVGIADVGNGLTTVALVVPASRSREIAGNKERFLESWLHSHPHLAPRFARAQRMTPVMATGPFASHSRRAWAPGAALIGDAADFFDPFTGEGIYSALRGGEMLAECVREALAARKPKDADGAFANYDARRRKEFRGKWIVERVIGAVVGNRALIDRAAHNLSRRKDLSDLLIGVTGDFVPPSTVIGAGFLWRVFGNAG